MNRGKSILDIQNNECRWVVSPGFFCAAPSSDRHKSWCEHHLNMVFLPPPKRKKKKIGLMAYLRVKINF